jgi:hypothetical protein
MSFSRFAAALAVAVAVPAVTANVAEAQVPDQPRMSQRSGCAGLTGQQCNAKRHRIHALGYRTCNTWPCVQRVKKKRERRLRLEQQRIRRAQQREWRYWSRLYIPSCTWQGESGLGPQFADWRYTVPNKGGSGAYGKYQMMPGTYHAYAKYGDWSPLDQEIAGHRLYWDQGTSPWQAC